MSDRTYAQVIVYDCPEDQRQAALEAIAETFGWSPNEPGGTIETLTLGERYGDDGMAGDASEDLAAAIIEAAPGVTLAAWTDPAYDWLGSLVIYAPDLGTFGAECDAAGNATIDANDVRRLLAASMTEGPYGDRWPDANLREALREALGLAWDERVAELRARIAVQA